MAALANLALLLPLVVLAEADPLAAEREELEAQLEEARIQLDEAAERLGELHSKPYAMETVGQHGQKPMLGVLIGERGPNGGLLLHGVTPGGGAAAAGMLAGDEIISVNDVDLTDARRAMARLQETMSSVTPGDSVAVGYQRDGSLLRADVSTQAKGVFITGMTGAPAGSVDVEVLETRSGMTSHMARAIRVAGPGGLRLESITGDLAAYFSVESGVLVLAAPDGPDGEPGPLKAGDVLLAVDGEQIRHPADGFRTLMGGRHAADGCSAELTVEVMRNGVRELVMLMPAQIGGGHSAVTIRGVGSGEIEVIRPPSPPSPPGS
jgi:predicted metalloprotease with PDZ domain